VVRHSPRAAAPNFAPSWNLAPTDPAPVVYSPGVKQQLAAVRMLFDWLVTGQVVR